MGQCLSKKQDKYKIPDTPGSASNVGSGGFGSSGPVAQKQEFSWDKAKKLDPKDFMFDTLKGETKVKEPGSINGQQFIIKDCEDCHLYVFDRTAAVSIDDCKNCTIFIGPCESSIFIRDCTNCKCVIMCRQFRTRDCESMDVQLYCVTRPVIEASKKMRFGCIDFHYEGLKDQMDATKLSPYTNFWSYVHDFTPAVKNWDYLPAETRSDELLAPLPELPCLPAGGTPSPPPVLQVTWGDRPPQTWNEPVFVLFPASAGAHVEPFLKQIAGLQKIILCFANTTELHPDVAKQLVMLSGDEAHGKNCAKDLAQGKSFGFEFGGPNASIQIGSILPQLDSLICTTSSQAAGIYRYMGIEG